MKDTHYARLGGARRPNSHSFTTNTFVLFVAPHTNKMKYLPKSIYVNMFLHWNNVDMMKKDVGLL